MDATMTVDPKAHDEATAALELDLDKAQRKLASVIERTHRALGDKRIDRWTRRERWTLSTEETFAAIEAKADAHPIDEAIWGGDHPVNLLRHWQLASVEIHGLRENIAGMDAIYDQHRWQRFFPCNNSAGHIHATLACHTLNKGRYATDMSWRPSLSGHTVAEAIEDLGTWLCSVCFPDAPAEHCQTRSEATRAEREAKADARDAVRFIKKLREDEEFRVDGEWTRTVHRCLEILRHEVELRDYYGRGRHCDHAEYERGAAKATEVLLAREAAQEGTGRTQEQIAKVVANAVKTARSNGARLNPDGSINR